MKLRKEKYCTSNGMMLEFDNGQTNSRRVINKIFFEKSIWSYISAITLVYAAVNIQASSSVELVSKILRNLKGVYGDEKP